MATQTAGKVGELRCSHRRMRPGEGHVQGGGGDRSKTWLAGGVASPGGAVASWFAHEPGHGRAGPPLSDEDRRHGARECLMDCADRGPRLSPCAARWRNGWATFATASLPCPRVGETTEGCRAAVVHGRGPVRSICGRRVRGLRGQEATERPSVGLRTCREAAEGTQWPGRVRLFAARALQAPAVAGRRPRGPARGRREDRRRSRGGRPRRAARPAEGSEFLRQDLQRKVRLPNGGPARQHDRPFGLGRTRRAGAGVRGGSVPFGGE
mmetsp:Transcript_63735/g.184858  ORF Transcript_63735/g.184858 Transcript_63735/m.184858 type:complete len:267 (+) Transcript_63735:1727-2527(+)